MRIKERFASATVKQLTAGNDSYLSGIAIVASGTVVASVACTGLNSGDTVFTQPYMYAGNVFTQSASKFLNTAVMSVRAGAFEIAMVGSAAPADTLPVAWFVIRR
jgi:electron transfer flavoprotein alpha subunit